MAFVDAGSTAIHHSRTWIGESSPVLLPNPLHSLRTSGPDTPVTSTWWWLLDPRIKEAEDLRTIVASGEPCST